MPKKRIAIAGASHMARVRGRALLETGGAEICAVASRHMETARRCAEEMGCPSWCDHFHRLAEARPDAVLIEVPHQVQDEIALWALEAGYDLLIGGCLSATLQTGRRILELAARHRRIVEAGYQDRYHPAWEEIRRLIRGGTLGKPVMAVTMAQWDADPQSWYYDQESSGGMPLTHMSYCYLNGVRWILGRPRSVSAAANRLVETAPARVREESCGTLIGFENGAFASATASFLALDGMPDARIRFICTRGGILVHAETAPGTAAITVFRDGQSEHRSFEVKPSPFVRQAEAFLKSMATRREARNPPVDALLDVQIAEAISLAAREGRTVPLEE